MPADTTAPIIAAARQRHELTRSKAIQALRELDHAGTQVTFATVADKAGISRSWLYTQPDIRRDIERLRETTSRTPAPIVPTGQRSSDTSWTARLRAANQRIRELTTDNQRLRRQLAHALGDQRASPPRANTPPELGPQGHTPTTITPNRP
jgi:hypothetical protein